jgi:hypothetical protein
MVPQCVRERSTNDIGKIPGREAGDEPVATGPPTAIPVGTSPLVAGFAATVVNVKKVTMRPTLETHEVGRCASAARGDAVAAPTPKMNSRRRIRSPRRRCPQQCGSRLAQSPEAVSQARFLS